MKTDFVKQRLPPGYHFAVLETPCKDQTDNLACILRQIVIKDKDGLVTPRGFTKLETYVHPYGGRWTYEKVPTQQELIDVCQALNFFAEHGATKLWDIDKDMVYQFFDHYRTKEVHGKEGRQQHVNDASLSLCVRTVSAFLCNLSKDGLVKIEPEELMRCEYRRSQRTRRETKAFVPIYSKRAISSAPGILMRDMPEEAVGTLMELARIYDPMIRFAIALQAYAGLREGEAMNVRQERSPLSHVPGIKIRYEGTAVRGIDIDLTREFQLRSDGINVGRIKRNPNSPTEVYEKHRQTVYEAYLDHLQILERTHCEADYMPMFVCRNGKAMTRQAYCIRFGKLVGRLTDLWIDSEDPRLSAFAQYLLTYHFAPHALRHYFSVHLALDGLDVSRIMALRGDRNPDSALTYFQNKGMLREKAERYHTIALEGLTRIGTYHD